jgi:hypothetical protein
MDDHRAGATSAGTALPDRGKASQNQACAASHQSRKPDLPWSSDTLNSFNGFMACLLTKIRCAAEAVRNAG